jgi:diguanylate cyclase (GGDEF)-like protein
MTERSRTTIGLFLDNFYGEYGNRIVAGASRAAEELEAMLISYADNSINDPNHVAREENDLFRLAEPGALDALIVLPPSISDSGAKERFALFLEAFSALPIVRVGDDDAAFMRVVIENRKGMGELVDHLIERHGRSRIAFIRGPEGVSDAEARYAAYRASLKAHGIPFRPSLVLPGDFRRASGTAAAARLLDDRESFDALVAANDYMALYAMKELQRRGIRVPDEVSVAGFDDFLAARSNVPGLCTVHQPMEALGAEAVRLALSAVHGKTGRAERRSLSTRLVARRSCGCLSLGAADTGSPSSKELFMDAEAYRALGEALVDDPEARFRILLEDAVVAAYARGTPVSAWQDLALGLTRGLPIGARWDAERSIARFLSALQEEIASRALLAQIEEGSVFDQLSGRLLGSSDAQAVREVLKGELSCRSAFFCLSLFTGDEIATVLYCTDQSLEGASFPPRLLVPGGHDSLPLRSDLLVVPLADRDEPLGFFVCAAQDRQLSFYEALGEHLGGALKGADLVARIREHSATLERKVEERTSELSRALSELEATNEKLKRLSTVDELTGLYNRRGFFDLAGKQIDIAKRRGSNILLIYFDLDYLKKINDRHGHAEGDEALKAIATVLIRAFRQTDVVARLGGDEFTVLAIDCTIKECDIMIRRAHALLDGFNEDSGKPYALSFCFGAAPSIGHPATNLGELMAEADARLYEAKRIAKEMHPEDLCP